MWSSSASASASALSLSFSSCLLFSDFDRWNQIHKFKYKRMFKFKCLNELIDKYIDHWWHLNSIILQILSSIINCGFWLLSKIERFNDTSFIEWKNIKIMLIKIEWMNEWINKQTLKSNYKIIHLIHFGARWRNLFSRFNFDVRTKW